MPNEMSLPLSCSYFVRSTWGIMIRTMLLWFACISRFSRSRPLVKAAPDTDSTPESAELEDADFAMRVWMETTAIEEALETHRCDGEKVTMWQVGRAAAFSMSITCLR